MAPERNILGIGNTKMPRRDAAAICWSATINNPNRALLDTWLQWLQEEADKWVFQLEEGEEGTPHFQMAVRWKTKKRLSTIKNMEEARGLDLGHWEKAKEWEALVKYCQKNEGRLAGPWLHGVPRIRERKALPEAAGWQKEVLDMVMMEPDDRTVHWWWSDEGAIGKTTMCKILVRHHGAILVNGRTCDMACALNSYVQKWDNGPPIVVVNLSRGQGNRLSYGGLEGIKDGLLFSSKYESTQIDIDSPHVFVFANEPPRYGELSEDRWDVRKVEAFNR